MQSSSSNVATVNFFTKFTASEQFEKVFKEGMSLVEETANYLDGPGRLDARVLERHGAIAYATESMRLTTRLMQLASWLLLHRAVKEGEMSLTQANKEKTKVKLSAVDSHDPNNMELLPAVLCALIARSQTLQGKVRRLDATIHDYAAAERLSAVNPVERQLGLLKAAFGAESV